MKFILVSFFLLSNSAWSFDSKLSPLKTDYCTNYPEGTRETPDLWKHCCLMHDMYFWAGGNKKDRDNADHELRSCIKATGAIAQSRLMYLAVRLGSYSPLKYPKKKWNHGWAKRPEFQTLSRDDILEIERELESGYDFVSPEIKKNFVNNLISRRE